MYANQHEKAFVNCILNNPKVQRVGIHQFSFLEYPTAGPASGLGVNSTRSISHADVWCEL